MGSSRKWIFHRYCSQYELILLPPGRLGLPPDSDPELVDSKKIEGFYHHLRLIGALVVRHSIIKRPEHKFILEGIIKNLFLLYVHKIFIYLYRNRPNGGACTSSSVTCTRDWYTCHILPNRQLHSTSVSLIDNRTATPLAIFMSVLQYTDLSHCISRLSFSSYL